MRSEESRELQDVRRFSGALSAPLIEALSLFPVRQLHFQHRLTARLQGDSFKGGLWHSVFGLALHQVSEPAFNALMAAGPGPRPWNLRPPHEPAQEVPAGTLLEGCISLLGEHAIGWEPACLAALQAMGRNGFGRNRAGAELVAAWCESPPHVPAQNEGVFSLWDAWNDGIEQLRGIDVSRAALRVELLTPLRLKLQGEPVHGAPPLSLLTRAALHRLLQQLPDRPGGSFARGEYASFSALAQECGLVAHDVQLERTDRLSARTGQRMALEGLSGALLYAAPAALLLPLLKVGEVLQLGAAVTFGQGVVRAQVVP